METLSQRAQGRCRQKEIRMFGQKAVRQAETAPAERFRETAVQAAGRAEKSVWQPAETMCPGPGRTLPEQHRSPGQASAQGRQAEMPAV